MDINVLKALENELIQVDKFCFQNTQELNKYAVLTAAQKLDKQLFSVLIRNETLRSYFFSKIEGVYIFEREIFLAVIEQNRLDGDSYTLFSNEIGLFSEDSFIKNSSKVVLAFPYKDAILKGGQQKDAQKKTEHFYNVALEQEQIDRLFSPKTFCKWERFSQQHATQLAPTATDNFVFQGNNLIVLHSLLPVFRNKIKLIYIDPPYNTGGDSFNYNDSFNHSSWLVFMKNRIEVARELLTDDGSLWINIDDHESHYLKVLTDEIFGREHFVINFIWEKKYAPANDAKYFSDNHDHILVYAKNKKQFKPQLLNRTSAMNKRYTNPDNDSRGPWKPGGFSVKTYSKSYDYPITTPSGKVVWPPKGSCWQTSEKKFKDLLADNRIYFGKNGDAKPQIKQFLTEVKQGTVAKSVWRFDEVGHNQVSRSEIIAYFDEFVFATPKPEKLLQRIIHLGTNPGDRVLDFFAGSGTTGAVALKMQRKFILIEQMDYANKVTFERIKKVITGSQAGISEELHWQGGGEAVFARLAEKSAFVPEQILKLTTPTDLLKWARYLYRSTGLNVEFSELTENAFLKFLEQKKSLRKMHEALLEAVDWNDAYVHFSERNDSMNPISNHDIACSEAFYRLEQP